VAVIVDSASALPTAMTAAAGISVIPLRLNVGGDSFADGQVGLEQLVDLLDDEVKTSAPSPGEWVEVFDEALAAAERVLVLTVSAGMSSTFSSARLAASAYGDRIEVIDTGTAAGAEGLVALAAGVAATGGAPFEEVVARAERVRARVRLLATLSSLDHLARSGRVPSVAGWAGRHLGVNPVFQFVQGEVRAMRPALSRSAALDRILHTVEASAPAGPATLRGAALHALSPDAADHLATRLRASFDDVDVFVASFSPVMVVHTGPGLAGLAWWWDDTADEAAGGSGS
jgi:DegV family protein with EDD domain